MFRRLLMAVIILGFAVVTLSADDPVKQLPGWKEQRRSWEQYRVRLQSELNEKTTELERSRNAADVSAKETEINKRFQAIRKDGPGVIKDAFKESVSGAITPRTAWKTLEIAINTAKLTNATNSAIAIKIDLDSVQTRVASLEKETAELKKNIAIANQIMDFSSRRIAALQQSPLADFYSLPTWLQGTLIEIARAQQRRDARLEAEKREAERKRQQAAAQERRNRQVQKQAQKQAQEQETKRQREWTEETEARRKQHEQESQKRNLPFQQPTYPDGWPTAPSTSPPPSPYKPGSPGTPSEEDKEDDDSDVSVSPPS